MDLLIIRHGVAEDKEEWSATGQGDELRPLTAKGRKKMRRAAQGLRAIVDDIDLLATSPLVRAVQTAEIVCEVFGIPVSEQTETLKPDTSADVFADWLRKYAGRSLVAAVGHEPQLGALASWLAFGRTESRLSLGKGGACLLSFGADVDRDTATLCWLMKPKQLERLGD